MKNTAQVGDTHVFVHRVTRDDVAAFHGVVVHPVCSTFALARDMEWTTRHFALQLREEDEEGIGTHVRVDHKGPALVDEEITFTSRIEEINGNEIICSVEARVGNRLIATGRTGQKILKRDRIEKIFQQTG